MTYLYVAIGGAFGSLCRYLIIQWVGALAGREFPWAVLAVNVLGSFLMGLLLGFLASVMPKGRELYLLLGVGFLGGFTTFSAFTYDSYMLLERGDWWGAAAYIAGSVGLGLGAFLAGMWVFRLASA